MTRGVTAPTTQSTLERRDDNSRRTILCSQQLACSAWRDCQARHKSRIALHKSQSSVVALAALSYWPLARAYWPPARCSCVSALRCLVHTARAKETLCIGERATSSLCSTGMARDLTIRRDSDVFAFGEHPIVQRCGNARTRRRAVS
jgi:hypothetical protein